MKKTLVIVIALVLIMALSFALVACGESNNTTTPSNQTTDTDKTPADDDPGGNGSTTPSGDTEVAIRAEELGTYQTVTKKIINYAEQFVVNNANDKVDRAQDMQKALVAESTRLYNLAKKEDKKAVNPIDEITVTLKDGVYSIKFKYVDKKVYTYTNEKTLVAKAAVVGDNKGYGLADGDDVETLDMDSSLAVVYNSAIRAANDAMSSVFGSLMSGSLAANVQAGLALNYAKAINFDYSLRIAGNISFQSAKDTKVCIEVIDKNDKVVGGLYYIGAEQSKDCKLYLNIDIEEKDYHYHCYLDNADIYSLVSNMMGSGANDDDANFDDEDEFAAAEEDEEENFFALLEKDDYELFSDVLLDLLPPGENGEPLPVGMIMGIVSGLMTCRSSEISFTTASGDVQSGVRYQYQLDLGPLLTQLATGSLSSLLSKFNPMIKEMLPDFDLGTFKGIGGTLLLSFDMLGEDEDSYVLSGLQVAYNVDQRDFRFSDVDDQSKVYGPVNLAITLKDVVVGDSGVIDYGTDHEYFSPLNAKVSGDVTVTDGGKVTVYEVTAVSNFNPFILGEGQAEIILKNKRTEAEDMHIWFHDVDTENWDCTVTTLWDEVYYETKASESELFSKIFEDYVKAQLINRETKSSLAPISGYIWDLIDQFSPKTAETAAAEDEEEIDEADAESGINVTKLIGAIGAIKDLFIGDNAKYKDVFVYDFKDAENSKLYIVLGKDQYNDVIDALDGAIPSWKPFDEAAEVVGILIKMNYDAESQGALIVKVEYKDYLVSVKVSIKDCLVWADKVDKDGNVVLDKNGKAKRVFSIASNCKATAEVKITWPVEGAVKEYQYTASIECKGWDTNKGKIIVLFNEGDGVRSSVSKLDNFVKVEIEQYWNDDKEYTGFKATATLSTRNADGTMKPHTLTVSGNYDKATKIASLTIDECKLTLGAGNGSFKTEGKIAFNIPKPYMGFDVIVKSCQKDIKVEVRNLTVEWGAKQTVAGINTDGKEVKTDVDTLLYNKIVGLANPFFFMGE